MCLKARRTKTLYVIGERKISLWTLGTGSRKGVLEKIAGGESE
jgi:hypothetical protein